jgi:L-alanine-DL-glutamate epimerase-like enolase superfamily enzyme
MKIKSIHISVFETKTLSPPFQLVEEARGANRRWLRQAHARSTGERVTGHLHVLHVRTDEGVEGVCTVGDARYRTMRVKDLEQLRVLALGEDPFDRERLNLKLHAATRGMFARQGWYGAFDNCLWDIAGKVAGLPVYALLGRARERCPAYLNIGGGRGPDADRIAVQDAQQAVEVGFQAVKDHFRDSAAANVARFRAVREAVGSDIDVLHDAALAGYTFDEALYVGRALEELRFAWFEEPLPDVRQAELKRLCDALDVPILAPETMMNDVDLSAQWLIAGATDHLRTNARHGTTSALKLAHLAELHGANAEFNGPGGLFGLVHAHLVCAIRNTRFYEYFPGGSRDEAGYEIGLLNPPLPKAGYIVPPNAPGWGAEWDWAAFRQARVARL